MCAHPFSGIGTLGLRNPAYATVDKNKNPGSASDMYVCSGESRNWVSREARNIKFI